MPVEIRKPDVDHRAYKYLSLSNKLSVLLVSDPETDKASAALDVHVGHLLDPPEAAGLAHFCEHLLFMVFCFYLTLYKLIDDV
jgi:insulysin